MIEKDVSIMGKHYDYEYKQYVAKLVVEEGRKGTEISYELDIPYGTLCRWVQNYKKEHKVSSASHKHVTPSEHEKALKQQENEIKKLKEENEILKKAMHIFTKNQK